MSELKTVLVNRDKMTSQQADDKITEMKERVSNGENPDDLLYEIGLEPDYMEEIMPDSYWEVVAVGMFGL